MSKTLDALPETKTEESQQKGSELPATDTRRDFTTKFFAGLIGALVMFIPLVSGVPFALLGRLL